MRSRGGRWFKGGESTLYRELGEHGLGPEAPGLTAS